MKRIVLISCAATKVKKGPVAAKDLYISPMFKLAWKYAEMLKPTQIYILSAEHKLVKPDTKLMPYNKTLNNMGVAERKAWAAEVIRQMKAEGIDLKKDEIILLAGNNYSKYLLPYLGNYSLPYQDNGCKGMGYILQFLKNATSKRNSKRP